MNLLKSSGSVQYGLEIVLLALVIFLFVLQGDGFAQAKNPVLAIGEASKIKSKILGEELKLFIYVPDDYDRSSKRYPVLYHFYDEGLIHLFHYSTGVTHFLAESRMSPPMMVVSVQVNGMRDLTPTKASNYGPHSGGADNYIKFLKEELIPYIDKTYRTKPYRIVWGHSIAGTLCVYTLLSAPEVFDAYITSSPYIIYDDYDAFILKNTAKFLKQRTNEKNFLFITVGANEPHLLPRLQEFNKILNTMKPKGLKWEFKVENNENHNTVQSLCLQEGLKILYSR